MKTYHNLSVNQTLLDISSSAKGLSEEQVVGRASTMRPDKPPQKYNIGIKFLEQFADFMIIILLLASAISIVIGIVEKQASEIVDGCIILLIVLMNAIFGVIQEYKAEKSLEALSKLTKAECYVFRSGEKKKIKAEYLVAGDIVILEAGAIVPADLRLIESHGLKIDESALTGESKVSNKNAEIVVGASSAINDRKNMAYKGTIVSCGRGVGVVIALGEDTEIGKIASAISESKKELSPLQRSIKDIGKVLTILILVIAVVTFIIEIAITPNSIMDAFLTAVAISVAAIPESMPAVITIIMSMGVASLAKEKTIVKRLPAVETLGSCDVICSDKTGTITQNKMTITSLYYNGKMRDLKEKPSKEMGMLLLCGRLCNDGEILKGKISGDPTERAILELCHKNKVDVEGYNRLDEMPFDSNRKLMSVLVEKQEESFVFVKGACDRLLPKCTKILKNGEEKSITEEDKKEISVALEEMSEEALRTIGFAYKKSNHLSGEELIFIGLAGMIDPPKKETVEAVKKCRRAGMKPIMITGDYGKTALAIARQIGLAKSMNEVMSGEELARLNDTELEGCIEKYSVFARVSPQDKMRIVEALKKKGHVVAMTGDGVNDAPSLKKANIGIGMGQSGTDVAKEVADMIITDDNFSTIVVAIGQGRKIYQNIQKTVKFLFSANTAELLSLFIITLLYPQFVFLYPVQILFTNLITDSLPAIALGLEVPEVDLMEKPPRDKRKGLFADGNGISIIVLGIVQTLIVIASYIIGLKYSPEIATTMGFYTLNIVQMFYLASMRTRKSIFKSKPFKNKFFLLAVGFCFALSLLFATTPLGRVLKLVPLPISLWGIIILLSFGMTIISEIYKLIENKILKNKNKINN